MGHTNDEENDSEGFKLKDIVKDEEYDADLNNEDSLHQFDFLLSIFNFFFTLCVTLQPRNDAIFAQQCLKDIFSHDLIKYGLKLNCNHVFCKCINLEWSYFPCSGIHTGSGLQTDRVALG